MRLRVYRQGAIVIVAPSDQIMDEGVKAFSDKIAELLDKGENKIIIELGSVTFIDSEGLEVLLEMTSRARSAGGRINVANPNEVCSDIFRVTRLSNLLEIYNSIDEARRSFL